MPMAWRYAASGTSLLAASAAQLLTFGILARHLGPEQFGLFVAISAITSVAVQFCGLGATESLVRRVAQDRAIYPRMLGHSIILTVASGLALILVGLVILPLLFTLAPDPWLNALVTLLMLVTNILLVRGISQAEQIYLALSDFNSANRVVIGFALARTAAAALACLGFGVATVADWAVWQFGVHVLVMLACWWALRSLGGPVWVLVRDEIRLGLLFSTPFVFKAIRQNADLLVIGLVASPEIVGSYGVARRILESSYLSIDAMHRLIYPGFAVAAADGLHHAMPRIRKVLVAATGVSVATAIVVFLLAPALPLLFGAEYVSLPGFTRILCWLVIALAIQSVATQALGASSRHGYRAAILNIGSLVGALLVAWGSWVAPPTGAFIASYVSEIAMTIAAWYAVLHVAGRDRAMPNSPTATI